MMPEGNPMALGDSQQSRRWRELVEKQGHCATLGLHGQCHAQYCSPPSPLFHPRAPQSSAASQYRPSPTTRATHQATPTGFIGFLPFLRVGMYSTPSGSPPLPGS